MSSYYQNGNHADDRDRKLSGFSKRSSADVPEEGGKKRKNRGRTMLARRNQRMWVSLLVDLILLVLVVGLIVGGIFGYRAVRELYAPVWEVREVVFGVKMENIPPELIKLTSDGRYVMESKPMWSSENIDADMMGTVTALRTVLVSTEESDTVTLYLQVEAKAYYREGKGYRMGETLLLAGAEGKYRLEGLTADGTIIFMHEKADKDAHTSWSDRFEQENNVTNNKK